MGKDPLSVQEKEFVSGSSKGIFNRANPDNMYKKSDLYKYLISVCIDDPQHCNGKPNFFDGNILAHVAYTENIKYAEKVRTSEEGGPYVKREEVKIRWQPGDKEPSQLIKKITEEFGLEEVK